MLEPAEEAAVFGAPSCWPFCGPAVAVVVGPLCAGAGGPGVVAATVAAVANVRRSPTGGVCCRFQSQRLLVLELLPACPTAAALRGSWWPWLVLCAGARTRAGTAWPLLPSALPPLPSPARLPGGLSERPPVSQPRQTASGKLPTLLNPLC